MEKVMDAATAVSKYIKDGDVVYLGGFAANISYALIHEIIRQKKKNLTIVTSSFNEHGDQLIGAGCVSRVVTSYFWMEVFGQCYSFRRSLEKGIPQPLEIEDYSNFSMTMRLWAGAMGIPYVPVNSIKGSDIAKHTSWMGENKVHIAEDPFSSGTIHALVPALKPDLAILHCHRSDNRGNLQIWGQLGDIPWGARASRTVIATVEEVVDSDVVKHDPNRTCVPEFMVSAVVPEPWASHPKPVQGYYDVDRDFIFKYINASKTEAGLQDYFDKWIYGVKDRTEYLEKFIKEYGLQRLQNLKSKQYASFSVNYGA
ncbi:MAG: CoA transferase subunit A [Firmicutes bacterium]|nr:CoA transferase subunit A [Bacillota bacterium]